MRDILIPIDKQINLSRLDAEISAAPAYARWETKAQKRGFSGINSAIITIDGVQYQRLQIVWTDDGINGYVKDLTQNQVDAIQEFITNHNG